MNIQRIQVDIIRTKAAVDLVSRGILDYLLICFFEEILYQDKEVLIFIREDQNIFKNIKWKLGFQKILWSSTVWQMSFLFLKASRLSLLKYWSENQVTLTDSQNRYYSSCK